MKQGNRPDLQIYSSDSQTTDVTIGEWKTYRKTNLKTITGRLCTYADLVCDYIMMDREVLLAMGITSLPNDATDAIDAIVVRQGRECVPYSTASNPVALDVYLSKNSSTDMFIGFSFSGEYNQFPSIKCDETYVGTVTVEYDYNTIVAYTSVDIDNESENINKTLCIELNNFDLVPFIATNTPTAYKNAGHTWEQSLNINGSIVFDKVVSTEISSQRRLYFKIKGGTQSQYPNPEQDQKYQYNLFSIIKFGGFSSDKIPSYYTGLVYPLDRSGLTDYYKGILTQYKKEYAGYPFREGGDYDYGGRLSLSLMTYSGTEPQTYDLWPYFNDNIASTTMCPQSGYFEPGMLDDGVATITVTGVKNHSVRVMLQTDGKVIVRNISNIDVSDVTNYDKVKMKGKPVVLISDTYGTADSDISNPGMVKLAILPAEKPEPEGRGDYDRYKVGLSVNGAEPTLWKIFKFASDGYVLDVNAIFLGSQNHPLKVTDTYKLVFETVHKYIPKTITFRVFKEILFKINPFIVNGTQVQAIDSGAYWDYKYTTQEGDSDKKITVTAGYFYRPDAGTTDWTLWEKFFGTKSPDTGEEIPAEYQMIRISLNNGRYNKNASFTYYPRTNITPTSTQYVHFSNLTFINGDSEETASSFPRNTNLYIRTLGRIELYVRLYSLYKYRDTYYNGKQASGDHLDFLTYITSEEVTSGFQFWMTRMNGANNTIRPRVNYIGPDSDAYDSNVSISPASTIKCEVGVEQEIVIRNIDIMRPRIYLILQEIQTSALTVNILVNENLQYVKSDYTITDVPSDNLSAAVYIGIEHYSNESVLLGIAKIANRETPYTVYPSKEGRKYSGGMYSYQFDIATTKWKFAFERITDSPKNNFQRTTLLKEVNLAGDIVDAETDKKITISDNKFNMNGAIVQYQSFKVTNKPGMDNVTITMTPTRWNIAVIEMSLKKLTLKYDTEYGPCWLQPSLISPYGQTYDSAITWTSQGGNTEECWFYVPEYNDFAGSDLFPANASGEHRRVWIKFTPSYRQGQTIKPIPSNTQTTLIGYNAIFIDNSGSSSSQSFNLGNTESTQFDSHQFEEVQNRLGKTQHDVHGTTYKFKIELNPIEGEPHMILVGVVINNIRYMANDFDTNPPVIPPTKNMAMDFYLYCPYIHSGTESGNFTGGIPYNNVFTHTDGITSTTPGDLNGQPYTHIFTFRNNVSKDFWELNEQYSTNGVGTGNTYNFSVQLTILAGPTYTQGVDCVTASIGNNVLESDKLSIMPDIGEKMTVNAWTWIWTSTDQSNPKVVEKKKKIAADQSSTLPWFHYEFVGASSGITPSDVFNITGGSDTDGIYTFTVKSKSSQSYMQLRLQLQYQETVSYIENKQLDVALATKMMPYKVEAYNGFALSEDYKYIYTLKRDGTVGVIYVYLNCPQIEVDGGEIIVTSPSFIGSTIDRATSPNYNRIVRFTNNQDYWDKVNPSSFNPATDPYENREVTLEIEYRSNDIPEYPKLSYTYNVGAIGRTSYNTFEITGDETASAIPGSSFHVTVQRKTYISTGYKELIQDEGDFPFAVEFSIKEEGYNFDDYFTVSFNPQLGNRSHTITVKNDAQILVPLTVVTRPKMVSNDFNWIGLERFYTQIDVKLYINLFTSQNGLSDPFFFLTPYEYNIFIKSNEGSNMFRLNDKTINGKKYYFASFMVKKENGLVKLYRMTSATEYVPVYMSVGYSDPTSAQSGQTSWGTIMDSSDYTNVEQQYDAIVDDYITIIMNAPAPVGSTHPDVYAYPLGFIPTSQSIKSKVQVNWGLVQDFQLGPTALSTDTFWNYYSQAQVDAELG